MTIEEPKARVTLTIPAENIDDFRAGVIADLKSDTDWFRVQHGGMLKALARADESSRSISRQDRASAVKAIRGTCELIEQLPDGDVEATVSGTAEAFRSALDETGRELVKRAQHEFDYAPVPVEGVLPLLDRLRWTVEQIATIDEGAA
jgi:hypothetical protein